MVNEEIPKLDGFDSSSQIKDNAKLFKRLQELTAKEKQIVAEISPFIENLRATKDPEDKNMIFSQVKKLKDILKITNRQILDVINQLHLVKPVPTIPKVEMKLTPIVREIKSSTREAPIKKLEPKIYEKNDEKFAFSYLEKQTLKRMKKKEEEVAKESLKKPSEFVKYANQFFSKFSNSVSDHEMFETMKKDLIGANLMFTSTSYISVIFFTTFLSVFVAAFLFVIFLFFNFQITMPMLTPVTENFILRFFKVIWIIPIVPAATFLIMYFYPSLEKKAVETGINQEIPFATIHMSAICGSMIDPTKIFSILMATNEYPNLSREFTKLINAINIYGNNLEGALRDVASRTASKKLADLFNGLATTITSGGDLTEFFEKRSETLLFDYRIEREKYTKTAETFMDIYISVVIAAPMIFMLLLLMMKVSGFGISLSTGMITLLMGVGVAIMNSLFLVFLHLKQPSQ